jgi:hypothetical protein
MHIVFSIPITGKTPHGDGFKGQEWFDFRAGIFEKYTAKCLQKQTDKEFLVWLQFRPQEKDNPTTQRFIKALDGLKVIVTYNSPIMMEDKATWHNDNLLERAERSLEALQGIIQDEWVVEVGLDSDDCVREDFVEFIKSREMKDRGAFYMQKGWIYSTQDRLAEWNNPHSMSIYAIIYPRDIFLDAKKHFDYQQGFNSHEQIPEKFNAELLPDGMYCATAHGNNISTQWEHPYRGREIYNESDKIKILNSFI